MSYSSPPLNTTKEEEANIIKKMLHNQYSADYEDFTNNEDVLILIGTLLGNKNERKIFFSNPEEYVNLHIGEGFSKRYIAYICYYIECVMQNRIPNPMRYALDM